MAGNEGILIGGVAGSAPVTLDPRMANRHGLIAGATGTGKTVSLQLLAEGFSRIGVSVFLADIKGDLSGLAKPARLGDKIRQRITELALSNYQPRGNPVVFWDLHGVAGHPLRATISEAGPLLLSTMLELNDTQTGVLYSCFKLADDNGLLLLDLKDLRAILSWAGDNSSDLGRDYGNLSSSSIGAIQRKLLVLEQQGADRFFGEPAIRLQDLLQTDFSGNGVISVLDVTRLFANAPRLYAAFLLWLLSELFEQLPEVGDANKPRLVFFFDEAHLLFENAPRALLDKIEQVVRLIRSKGVGVYFISQSPLDIPQDVLGQLGLRIQHALRAFTPKDQKAVKTAAETFRPNPRLDTAKVITELGIGEALVSVLDARGSPTPVERVLICPPESRIGPLSDEERREHLSRSPFAGRYDEAVDRESAYELLKARAQQEIAAAAQAKSEQAAERAAPRGRSRQSVAEAMVTSAARAIGSQIGRQIMRGVLGSIMRR
jgi:DNA helicase HerA-like ATPase